MGDSVVHALDDVDLAIEAGEYLSVMGPSGSGKSTLLNILGLLDTPSRGRYFLGGQDTTTLSDAEQAEVRSERIGFVFQFFHLVPRLTAAENIDLPLLLAGRAPEERRERVAGILTDMGLSDRAHHRPDQLSGGQRQRVAIGRAIAMDPDVILADEPTGNLDRHSGEEVVGILEALNRDAGLTLVVVTHDPELGERPPRRVGMLDGRIESDDRREGGG
ncbi:MAG TPA: ABC transporter ATP-binding protein [Gammaproteobacteria bacterium]|nr:ABC transporter ATP-binding protein [Gammaproteobacteria bacterium]